MNNESGSRLKRAKHGIDNLGNHSIDRHRRGCGVELPIQKPTILPREFAWRTGRQLISWAPADDRWLAA